MKIKALAVAVALLAVFAGTAIVLALLPGKPPTAEPPKTVQLNADVIFTKVNDVRVQNGLKPLVRDARLDATAQERADDMVNRNYFSHYDPVDGHKMINDQPKVCLGMSENISMNWQTEDKAVSGWMGSKPHHDAILRTDYTLTGVAVNGNKVVQQFCVAK